METTSYERDHHTSSEPDQTIRYLSIGREYTRSIRSHKDHCMDLEAPLAQESRPSCNPPDGKEQETSLASCPYRALPDLRWPRPGSSFHGVADGMGGSSSPGSSGFGCDSPHVSETQHSERPGRSRQLRARHHTDLPRHSPVIHCCLPDSASSLQIRYCRLDHMYPLVGHGTLSYHGWNPMEF